MNLPNFWYGSCSYGPLWENHTLYAGKILIWRNFGNLRPKFGHFLGKKWLFWDFLTHNFQTQLWIFLILVWNFFEFWLFPGNQSYCVLLFIYYHFHSFEIGRRRFLSFFCRRRETSALRACWLLIYWKDNFLTKSALLQNVNIGFLARDIGVRYGRVWR